MKAILPALLRRVDPELRYRLPVETLTWRSHRSRSLAVRCRVKKRGSWHE